MMNELLEYIQGILLKKDIKTFRQERINLIKDGNSIGAELCEGSKIVLHVIPEKSITTEEIVDITKFDMGNYIAELTPIYQSADCRYNSEGFLMYSETESKIRSYSQFFRNGIIEVVDVYYLNGPNKEAWDWTTLESKMYSSILRYTNLLKRFDISKPWHIAVSFLNAKGVFSRSGRYPEYSIDKDEIHAVKKIWDSEQSFDEIVKPIFDSLANAFGMSKSPNFQADGSYKKSR